MQSVPNNLFDAKSKLSILTGGINSNLAGIIYQVKIFLLTMEKVSSNPFQIATELKEAESFDDIVVHIPNSGSRFIQSKFKSSTFNLGLKHFFTENQSDFLLLHKYFGSYVKLKANFNSINDIIICTNRGFSKQQDMIEFKDGKNVAVRFKKIKDPDTIFGGFDGRYKFDLSDTCTKNYLREKFISREMKQNKTLPLPDAEKYVDDHLLEFMDRLLLIVNLQNEDVDLELTPFLQQRFKLSKVEFILQILENCLINWIKGLSSFDYLDSQKLQKLFDDIQWKSQTLPKLLGKSSSLFDGKIPEFNSNKKIVDLFNEIDGNSANVIYNLVTSTNETFYGSCMVYQNIKNLFKDTYLFVKASDSQGQLKEFEMFIKQKNFELLIFICDVRDAFVNQYENEGLAIAAMADKNILIISDQEVLLGNPNITVKCFKIDKFRLSDLTQSSLNSTLQNKVKFQDVDVTFDQLIDKSNIVILSSIYLKDLEEKKSIGRNVVNLTNFDMKFYIERTLAPNLRFDSFMGSLDKHQIFLLIDKEGTGKTIWLNYLAHSLKIKFKDHFIVNMRLFTFPSDKCRDEKSLIDLIGKDVLKLEDKLEFTILQEAFYKTGKVKIILDEISSDDLKFLKILKESAMKIDNIFISTTPDQITTLKKVFMENSHKLSPFKREEQVQLFVNHWQNNEKIKKNYGVDDLKKMAQEIFLKYPEKLQRKFPSTSPLILRFLAEIFEEKILKLCSTNCRFQVSFKNINSFSLGLEEKKTFFIWEEKLNVNLKDPKVLRFLKMNRFVSQSQSTNIVETQGVPDVTLKDLENNLNNAIVLIEMQKDKYSDYFDPAIFLNKIFLVHEMVDQFLKEFLIDKEYKFFRRFFNREIKSSNDTKNAHQLYGKTLRSNKNLFAQIMKVAGEELNYEISNFIFQALIEIDLEEGAEKIVQQILTESEPFAIEFESRDLLKVLDKINNLVGFQFVQEILLKSTENFQYFGKVICDTDYYAKTLIWIVRKCAEPDADLRKIFKRILFSKTWFNSNILSDFLSSMTTEAEIGKVIKLLFSKDDCGHFFWNCLVLKFHQIKSNFEIVFNWLEENYVNERNLLKTLINLAEDKIEFPTTTLTVIDNGICLTNFGILRRVEVGYDFYDDAIFIQFALMSQNLFLSDLLGFMKIRNQEVFLIVDKYLSNIKPHARIGELLLEEFKENSNCIFNDISRVEIKNCCSTKDIEEPEATKLENTLYFFLRSLLNAIKIEKEKLLVKEILAREGLLTFQKHDLMEILDDVNDQLGLEFTNEIIKGSKPKLFESLIPLQYFRMINWIFKNTSNDFTEDFLLHQDQNGNTLLHGENAFVYFDLLPNVSNKFQEKLLKIKNNKGEIFMNFIMGIKNPEKIEKEEEDEEETYLSKDEYSKNIHSYFKFIEKHMDKKSIKKILTVKDSFEQILPFYNSYEIQNLPIFNTNLKILLNWLFQLYGTDKTFLQIFILYQDQMGDTILQKIEDLSDLLMILEAISKISLPLLMELLSLKSKDGKNYLHFVNSNAVLKKLLGILKFDWKFLQSLAGEKDNFGNTWLFYIFNNNSLFNFEVIDEFLSGEFFKDLILSTNEVNQNFLFTLKYSKSSDLLKKGNFEKIYECLNFILKKFGADVDLFQKFLCKKDNQGLNYLEFYKKSFEECNFCNEFMNEEDGNLIENFIKLKFETDYNVFFE